MFRWLRQFFSGDVLRSETQITISLAYYEDGQNLSRQLSAMDLYPETVKLQIIDDGSTQDPIENYLNDIPKRIDLFKINEDIAWNIPGVRNLSATVATTPWILILDMDQIIPLSELLKILNIPLTDPNHFYSFNRRLENKTKFTAGTMLVSRELWWRAGGYDEDFVSNYGYNDPFFRLRLSAVGGVEKRLKNIWITQQDADCELSRSGQEVNKLLFAEKVEGYEHSSAEILRFKWKRLLRD